MSAPFGYPDWQRTGPYDGPKLAGYSLLNTGASFVVVGPFNVNRWAEFAGRIRCVSGQVDVGIQWSDTEDFTLAIGVRNFNLDSIVFGYLYHSFPNMGPWVRMTLSGIQGPANVALDCWGSNREQELEIIPAQPAIFNLPNLIINSGVPTIFYSNVYHQGRAHLWIEPQDPATGIACALDVLNGAGTYDPFWGVYDMTGARADYNFEVEIPMGTIRMRWNQITGSDQRIYAMLVPGR